MEDYEVRDVMDRSSVPALDLVIRMEGIQLHPGAKIPVPHASNSPPPVSLPVDVSVTVVNHASTPAEYAIFQLFGSEGIIIITPGTFSRPAYPTFQPVHVDPVEGFTKGASLSMNHSIPGNMPIWSGPHWNVADTLKLGIPTTGYHQLHYTVQSPRMPIRGGWYTLYVDGTSVEVAALRPEHLTVHSTVDATIAVGMLRPEHLPERPSAF